MVFGQDDSLEQYKNLGGGQGRSSRVEKSAKKIHSVAAPHHYCSSWWGWEEM